MKENKRTIRWSCIAVVAVFVLTGISFYNYQNTHVSFVDNETVIDQNNNVIILPDGQVPLASKPEVSTETSTDENTEKVTLKKPAAKSSSTTKVTTKNNTDTSTQNDVKTTVATTVKTNVKTVDKKGSTDRTIITKTKTTVKTTKTALASKTSSAEVDIKSLAASAKPAIVNKFLDMGYTLKIDSSVPYSGVFQSASKSITLKKANNVIYHELGHFVAFTAQRADLTSEFKGIYNAEKSKYTASNKAYVTQNASEYFAESFKNYTENSSKLKSERPDTFTYIKGIVDNF